MYFFILFYGMKSYVSLCNTLTAVLDTYSLKISGLHGQDSSLCADDSRFLTNLVT